MVCPVDRKRTRLRLPPRSKILKCPSSLRAFSMSPNQRSRTGNVAIWGRSKYCRFSPGREQIWYVRRWHGAILVRSSLGPTFPRFNCPEVTPAYRYSDGPGQFRSFNLNWRSGSGRVPDCRPTGKDISLKAAGIQNCRTRCVQWRTTSCSTQDPPRGPAELAHLSSACTERMGFPLSARVVQARRWTKALTKLRGGAPFAGQALGPFVHSL